jgi:hypothetical protein
MFAGGEPSADEIVFAAVYVGALGELAGAAEDVEERRQKIADGAPEFDWGCGGDGGHECVSVRALRRDWIERDLSRV